MTKRTKREHANNSILLILSLATLLLAGFLLEFESAKNNRPDLAWPNTPSGIVLAVASVIGLGSVLVLAILALIYKKDLYNRPYLWWMTGFNLAIGLGLLAILVRDIGAWTLINFVLFP